MTGQTDVRALFDRPAPLTVGIEEEVMLVDAETLDLAPRALEVLAPLDDERFKPELPAAQLELVLPPLASATEVEHALLDARRALVAGLPSNIRAAGAGVHPFAAPLGVLNRGARYDLIAGEYGDVARAQLVFALQVHVCVRGADRALAVYNALRADLPLLAALAANGPLHAGRDTGLASVRPKVSKLLPRQGVPPVLATWDHYAAAVARLADPAQWWWELRPHPVHGTLEVRVPDTQATAAEAAAIAAVVHARATTLADRFDAGELLGAAPTWEIEEDAWLACRHGLAALGERVEALLDDVAPAAERQGTTELLAVARGLVATGGGAQRQRAAFERDGARAVVEGLAACFLEDRSG